MRATICIPTYNEIENLEAMVDALAMVVRKGDRVLVIDDASPDGTGELADCLTRSRSFLDVLHRREKEGLGPAYIAGFRRALADGAELVIEMDCDFSHRPEDVPRLITAAEDGADLVLGSRYVPGGTIPNWGAARRAISVGGNLYAQLVLGSRIRDLTGGFKCFRRTVLETIDFGANRSRGYAFQIETTYRVRQAGFHIREVPISFADRERGHSKMSKAIVAEAAWKVPQLRARGLAGNIGRAVRTREDAADHMVDDVAGGFQACVQPVAKATFAESMRPSKL
jgi:dolichol-phosphate mannosyltransferase